MMRKMRCRRLLWLYLMAALGVGGGETSGAAFSANGNRTAANSSSGSGGIFKSSSSLSSHSKISSSSSSIPKPATKAKLAEPPPPIPYVPLFDDDDDDAGGDGGGTRTSAVATTATGGGSSGGGSSGSGRPAATVTVPREKRELGLLERAAFGGFVDTSLDDYLVEAFVGNIAVAETDPVVAVAAAAGSAGLSARYEADYDYERVTGSASIGPSARAVGALGATVDGAANAKFAARAATRAVASYRYSRRDANAWAASASARGALQRQGGFFLQRAERSVNTPLVEQPAPPKGLLGR